MAHLVSAIHDTDFMAEQVRLADLNGDGAYEVLFIQSDDCTREITCLTAVSLDGRILWQTGTPSWGNRYTYSDLSVQVHDWDGDGRYEVLWIEQAVYAESLVWDYSLGKHITVPTSRRGELRGHKGWAQECAKRYEQDAIMHVLDGATGKEKASFPIPAPADDCIAFANLTGLAGRRDLVVKDRYWNLWGLANDGRVLWHWKGDTGHYPSVGDANGDGRDEVFLGWALLACDGRVIWQGPGGPHQDCSHIVRSGGQTRLVFSHGEGGEHPGGVHCLDVGGREIWSRDFGHGQFVLPGRYRPDLPGCQFAVGDLGWVQPKGPRQRPCICFLDWDGRELYRKELVAGASVTPHRVAWRGPQQPDYVAVLVGEFIVETQQSTNAPAVIMDAEGRELDTLPLLAGPAGPEKTPSYLIAADICGDGREELILTGKDCFNVYTNSDLPDPPPMLNVNAYGSR